MNGKQTYFKPIARVSSSVRVCSVCYPCKIAMIINIITCIICFIHWLLTLLLFYEGLNAIKNSGNKCDDEDSLFLPRLAFLQDWGLPGFCILIQNVFLVIR